jgi:DNA-binding NarL/FixJ family response regulator
MTAIRILIVDDVPQVRQDLCTLLPLVVDIEIVGEAANGREAVRLAETLQPEVILMDLEMPVLDGYEAARQIKTRCPTCRVIALTIHDYEAVWQRASQAGVDDFVVKGAPLERLVEAILAAPTPRWARA